MSGDDHSKSQPVTDEEVMAAVLAGIKDMQAESKMRAEKAAQAETRLSESIRLLEQFREQMVKAGGKQIFSGVKLPDGTLEVSAAGRNFRISPQGRFA